ncbi:MAG: RdgB/HAM1 family non-canonical purine NTP pyrophosphatase [Pelagibacteraceae bacterium]
MNIKNNKILIGTHNKGKFKEISYLISNKIKKISPNQLKISSPEETGKTFEANSKLKALYFYKLSGLVSISDDSGLVINCLDGKPGIYSARWAKKYGSFKKAMLQIIKLVKNKNKNKLKKNTKAYFVCSLSLKVPNKKIVNVTGKIMGNISYKILGNKGFGYDPIFIPNKYIITFGQMDKIKKMKMDHRFLAFKKLKKKINSL